MTRYLLALALLAATSTGAQAQQEGPISTQVLVSFDSKAPVMPTADNVTIKVNNRPGTLQGFAPVPSNGTQVAILIDDGLRLSRGRELDTLRSYGQGLPQGTEVFVGYMRNGGVAPGYEGETGFTTDLAAAAAAFRLPQGIPGASASPFFCLSDLVRNWPAGAESNPSAAAPRPARKARFILMITNGVDPYNGSTSVLNQDSPYVQSSILDAQRAGVPVYSIYFGDAGFRRERSTVSGQNYLSQVAESTGGISFYLGSGNPVSIAPYLKEFQLDVAQTYVATFPVSPSKDLASVKLSTNLPKTKVRAASQVRAGTIILQQQ